MESEPLRPRSHLFMVRLWLEPLGDGQTEWRGKVQHVPRVKRNTSATGRHPALIPQVGAGCLTYAQGAGQEVCWQRVSMGAQSVRSDRWLAIVAVWHN